MMYCKNSFHKAHVHRIASAQTVWTKQKIHSVWNEQLIMKSKKIVSTQQQDHFLIPSSDFLTWKWSLRSLNKAMQKLES